MIPQIVIRTVHQITQQSKIRVNKIYVRTTNVKNELAIIKI